MSTTEYPPSFLPHRTFHALLITGDEIGHYAELAKDLLANGQFLANLKRSGGYEAVSVDSEGRLRLTLKNNRTVGVSELVALNLAALSNLPQGSVTPRFADIWRTSVPFEGTVRDTVMFMRDIIASPSDMLFPLAKFGLNTARFTESSSGELAFVDSLLPGLTLALLKSIKVGSLGESYPRFRGLYLDDIE